MFDSKVRTLVTAAGGALLAVGMALAIPATALASPGYIHAPYANNDYTYTEGPNPQYVHVPHTTDGYGWVQ